MGKIKSTLDIIMEKTKNLTLTPEEKEVLRREDWLKKTRGRIQKFLDGAIDLKRLREETRAEERPPGAEGVLKEELVGALNPEGDNESRFLILKELFDTPIDPFREILQKGQKRLEEEKEKRNHELKEQLKTRGISGSAVLPNLALDPAWQSAFQESLQSCREKCLALL